MKRSGMARLAEAVDLTSVEAADLLASPGVAQRKGMTRDAARLILQKAGWTAKQIADIDVDRKKEGAWDLSGPTGGSGWHHARAVGA